MPKTLTEKLNAIKAAGKGIFVPYIMAGDHEKGLDGLAETIHFLEDLGVSAIEVGIPFSDPVADGPVIEEAGLRSLAHGTSTQALVETLKTIETEIPLVIMTYFNPLFQYGVENFVKDLADTAVKGLIIPDLPHEHANFVEPFLADTDIALIPLVSLTTGIERQKELIEGAEGFVYAVAINGVTGKSGNYRADLDKHLAQLHQVADIPVLTGFGVSSQADLERFNAVSDGVIVGSIEVGIPFSDPVADGPVIEEAGLRSLAHGTSTQALVETLKTIETEIPLVIMTYFNPLFQYGVENFVKDLADTAVKGLIIPDLPHEHANFVEPFLADTDIALIPLVSLTTGIERQKELIEGAEGFVYAVAINGVTGKSGNYRADLDKHLAQLHQVADIPVLTGFGVSSQADLERFNAVSDGVIVGSKIVKALHQGEPIQDFIRQAVAYQK
ncbi:tryptophan synthase subunit alpha [Streptococcus pneumoniae]|nr:tryptophan synthase subunit alpha [Streptococcus pneumoniae]